MVAYLLLGSNIEPRLDYFNKAKTLLAAKVGTILQTSALYQTAAWGNENQADFINQAIKIETTLEPLELLDAIKNIENATGRKQREHWGSREIDIDILLIETIYSLGYSSNSIPLEGDSEKEKDNNLNNRVSLIVFNHPKLQIPHPQLHNRRFALTPLADIAGSVIHPVFNKSIEALLAACQDKKTVQQ